MSYYSRSERGNSKDKLEIAMPPIGEVPPIEKLTSEDNNRSYSEPAPQPQSQGVFNVPSHVPESVMNAMQEPEIAVEEPVEEVVQQEVEVEPEIEEAAPVLSSKQENFRILRERAEKAEREREFLMEMIQKQKSANYQEPQEPVRQQEPEFDLGLDDDSYVEAKHAKAILKEMRQLKQELNSYRSQSAQSIVETRLKQQYPDFNSVVSAHTVSILNAEHPEIAASLAANPDDYSKGVSAYKIMKSMGIYKQSEETMAKKVEQLTQKQTIQKNIAKPKSVATVTPQRGSNALDNANAFANGLTKELRERLHKEMIQSIKAR